MKNSNIIKVILIITIIQLVTAINTYSSEREITFSNTTSDTVDDLHIEFTNRLTEWDSNKPHTFNSVRHDAGKNNHNFYGTSIPPGGSATMTFTLASGDITINRWWWTKGGNAINDGKRIGDIKADNFTNNLAFSGGPATGNGLIRVSCMGINAMYNYIPGAPPEQTAVMFMNFLHTNFNYGGVQRVFVNQNSPRQICAHGNRLGIPAEEIQIEILAMDLTSPVILLESSARMMDLHIVVEGLNDHILNRTVMDYTTISLRSSLPPYNVVDYTGTSLDSNGKGRFFSYFAQNNVPYWIVVDYKNGIETWSFNGQNRFINHKLSYDFTNSANKAFGGNLKQMGSRYCVYSGDADKNGVIDAADMSAVDNDAASFAVGYLNTDMNNDIVIDATDMVITENNASNFVVAVRP